MASSISSSISSSLSTSPSSSASSSASSSLSPSPSPVFTPTKGKFHVALDGVGLILQGAPDRLAYECKQAPIYNARFSGGDRSYTDFSFWWFFAQTDWSGGIKDAPSWDDDAKFYYSTNLDAWSEIGGIKLSRKQYPTGASGDEDFAFEVTCGVEGIINGSLKKIVATAENGDSRPHIYTANTGENQTFTDISTTTIDTLQDKVSQLSTRLDVLWASMTGAGSTSPSLYSVAIWQGSWTDLADNVQSVFSAAFFSSRTHCEYAGTMYVFNDGNSTTGLAKATKQLPTADADWTKVFQVVNDSGKIVASIGYNGNLYYLKSYSTYIEMWQYDLTNSINSLFYRFNNTNSPTYGVGDKLLVNRNNKLIITIPDNEIWELDDTTLTRLYLKDEFKRGGSTLAEIDPYLHTGCVVTDNKCWWGNFMYDGEHFYNTWKNDPDSTSDRPYPLFADTGTRIWETHSGDNTVLWSVDLTGAHYKGTADKNFVVFSNFDLVSSLDKLAYSVTALFKPLLTGQSIVVEYLVDEFSTSATWAVLGTASYAIDGGSIRDKTFVLPLGTLFKKIWFRVKLASGGSDTPTLNDFVMNYLPIPTYKKQWTLNINVGDEVKRLDGGLVATTGRELKGRLERAWWTKSVLDFQDVDYATTQLNGALSASAATLTVDSTYDFPEQGRLRIEDEEMTYTDKTPTTFTGVKRGARDTRAVAHSDDTVINNAYKIIITELQSKVPISLEDKDLEYTVGIFLREV